MILPAIDGILLLFHRPLAPGANTVMEHVEAFQRHSRFKVWSVNTALGFPKGLKGLRFRVVVLHYSLFGIWPYALDEDFLAYLESSDSHKIAFFQDEYRFCLPRFAFIDRYGVDCIYTLVEPKYFDEVYGRRTRARRVIHTIPGYVSDDLIAWARTHTKPYQARSIDVGYRARRLPYYLGREGREKHRVAVGFAERCSGLGLRLDIETDEAHRIYGNAWPKFLADCRVVLGVEAGGSLFDLEDAARRKHDQLLAENPGIGFEEMWRRALKEWDGRISYRTVSPRHFEAAALRVGQVLFEGRYSGVMVPDLHYIPLKKDFSNFEEVIAKLKNPKLWSEMTQNAYADLIASGRWSYAKFIGEFDSELLNLGISPGVDSELSARVTRLLDRDLSRRVALHKLRALKDLDFVGRRVLGRLLGPFRKVFRDRGGAKRP